MLALESNEEASSRIFFYQWTLVLATCGTFALSGVAAYYFWLAA